MPMAVVDDDAAYDFHELLFLLLPQFLLSLLRLLLLLPILCSG